MKNTRSLYLLFGANAVSNFASGITMLAIPWWMVSKLGEVDGKEKLAFLMSAITLVSLFWGILAGVLIDWFNRKRIFQLQQLIAGCFLGGAAAYGYVYQDVPFAIIAMAAAATILSWNIHYPNLYAFAQELFERRYYRKVNSAIELQGQLTNMIGMFAGAILLGGSGQYAWLPEALKFEPWPLERIFLMDSFTYFASIAIISFIRYSPGEYIRQAAGSIFSKVKKGYGYLRERPQLMVFGIASYTVFFCLLVFIHVIMAIYISDYLEYGFENGAGVMAGFEMLYSFGAVMAGLLGMMAYKKMRKTNAITQIIVLLLLMGGVFLTLSLTKSVVLLVFLAFFTGLSNAGIRILRITYIVRIVPNEYIGRVNSFFNVVNVSERFLVLILLGIPFFTAPGNGGNIIYATLLLSAACMISGLILWINFAKFDKEAEDE